VRYSEILHVLGGLLMAVGVAMIPAAALGVAEGTWLAWLVSLLIPGLLGLAFYVFTPGKVDLSAREALAIVGLGWLGIVFAGAVPFLITGTTDSVAWALFESVSGFTTTGATVFAVIEELPPSILLWRSISHWVGGMGIIVLGVAILPLIGVGGAQLFSAEAPGMTTDKVQPRIATTARLLWGVYVAMTFILGVFYLILGMSFFDAVNHAMSALATGGFSTRTASMGYYSPAIQWVTILFMFLAGVNFTLHYRTFTGHPREMFRNAEWQWYLTSVLAVSAVCFVALGVSEGEFSFELVRRATFSVASIHSTTGFGTADFAIWPLVTQVLLLGLMFMGGMGGSTGGGFKVIRGAVVTQHVLDEIRKVLHPRAVIITRVGGKPIREELVLKVLAFLAMYMATHAVILAALGNDLVTSLSASLAALSSIGPGLGEVGPAANYGHLGAPALVTLSALMLLGRLEFYTLLVLLIPSTWTRTHRTPRPPRVWRRERRRAATRTGRKADPMSSWPSHP
jgi:trk system potassium uptake protein TrkH